jgi:hypothetical protein
MVIPLVGEPEDGVDMFGLEPRMGDGKRRLEFVDRSDVIRVGSLGGKGIDGY